MPENEQMCEDLRHVLLYFENQVYLHAELVAQVVAKGGLLPPRAYTRDDALAEILGIISKYHKETPDE